MDDIIKQSGTVGKSISRRDREPGGCFAIKGDGNQAFDCPDFLRQGMIPAQPLDKMMDWTVDQPYLVMLNLQTYQFEAE